MSGRLDQRVAIVSGGNSGIGAATARTFAREGARVALMARREQEGVEVQDAIRAEGGDAKFIGCDVGDSEAVDAAVAAAVDHFGRIDILFNNAGGGAGENFPDESNEVWDRVIRVNLTGTFYMSRAVWPHLLAAGGGAIVNMSSLAATTGFSEAIQELAGGLPSSSYYAAKAGVDAFTRYLASMGGRHGIRANCVRPGQVITPGATNPAGDHWFKPMFEHMQIIPGPGMPEDVANVVLFLVSDEARFLTGEMVNIDGGMPRKL